jgi:hypothetical protein
VQADIKVSFMGPQDIDESEGGIGSLQQPVPFWKMRRYG